MAKSITRAAKAKPGDSSPDPFKVRQSEPTKPDPHVHIIRKGVRCATEKRGTARPQGKSPLEIVVDASQGFVPLWMKGTTLQWRFRPGTLAHFDDPDAAGKAIEELLGAAILAWGDAVPVKFAKNSAWDFEIIVRKNDDCDASGCVLASAFFPDAGQHQVVIYPKMFTQSETEQVETMAHEIGHIFGLRHFFALVSEAAWPAKVFGKHDKFSIMNYGNNSKLADYDKSDLRKLYEAAWAGELTEINGTPIKLVEPFHASGIVPGEELLPLAASRSARAPKRVRLSMH